MSTLYLIDASGFIFRAFYALPALTSPSGEPVGAVYGFCHMLMKLRNIIVNRIPSTSSALDPPNSAGAGAGTTGMTGAGAGVTRTGTAGATLWAAVFDVSRHTFRSEICPSYKANRKETPPELASQFGLIRDACTAFGCAVKEVPNFEADDVIASYAAQAQAQGISAVIVSSDKDFMQLYRPGVEIFDPLKSAWITESHIYQKFGVKPNRVVDVQSLAGDPTDGVVGVPGIGIKTAAELINQFGSLDVLLANLHTISQRKRKELMLQHVPDIRKAKELVTLREDVPVVINEDELRVHKKFTLDEVNNISAFYKKHGFSQNV